MKRFVWILALAVVFAAFQAVPAPVNASTEEISADLRAALNAPIVKLKKELLEEKDDLGASYIHGSHYEDFTPVGDGYEVTFAVNHLGHFLLVNLLLDCLESSSRILFVSSGAHDLGQVRGLMQPFRYIKAE